METWNSLYYLAIEIDEFLVRGLEMAKKAAKKETSKDSSKAKKAAKAPVEKAEKTEKTEKAPKKEAPAKKAAKTKGKKEGAAAASKAGEIDSRWAELREKYSKEKAHKYSMSGQFQANQAIEHPKLGWGFVLTNNNDRLEVLFQDGVRILISNYPPSQKI